MNENVVKLENNFNQVIERKIAVIFVTDVVGFSKLMEIDEDETPMSLPGADIFPEIDNEGFPAFEPQGNQPLGPYQDDAPPALPDSLQQAARQQPAVRRSIARLPANSPKYASTQDSKEE